MVMSIKEAERHLETYSSTNGSGITTQKQHEEAKEKARDTMRKYQELLDYIGGMNMCDEISNEAYKKIMIKFSE